MIFQSFNGYHIDKFKISKGNTRLNFLLNLIKEKHDEHSVNLIWNDLNTTKEIFKQDLLNTLCLISLPFIVKKGNQPINWISENSIKNIHSLEVLTIDCSDSLIHIISL